MTLETITAYELLRQEALTDIHSTGYLLRHKKSGARVMLIENDDENKVFNIAFRTTPKDSTGVAHIMEHSVLCGSKAFPLKDPFVELVKGSLNTFLNAMTYPDKTCYPVASCNDQDFQNLMHVYLDAVFYPNIYNTDKTFRQEGWNYHLENTEGPLTINGVVYNEMKGAFSSPDEVLEREIMNTLFPDTTYGCESGGDPDHIPELTYEQYLDFHRTCYHPSNSYIFLYGNMDMNEKLDFIDRAYLSAFDAIKVHTEIGMQKAFAQAKDVVRAYPVSESEGTEENTYLSYNVVVTDACDQKKCMAFEILDYALLSAPGAPLKQALLDAGIGKDVYGSFEDGILQPYFEIVAKNAELSDKEAFLKVIRDTLETIAREGIDREALLAGINYFEFRYREADFNAYPKGLMYSLDILESWLYDAEDPFLKVNQLPLFEELKKETETGYFEQLIRESLLDNPHGSVLCLVPSVGLQEKREEELARKLEIYRKSLSEEELQAMVEATEDLTAYQEAEEDPEALKLIPQLSREDIKKEVPAFCNEPLFFGENLFLYHEIVTNGIGYLELDFELPKLSAEDTHYLALLKNCLIYVDTENYTYGQLFNAINRSSGGITCGVPVFEQGDCENEYRIMFEIRSKALYSQFPFVFSMIREILTGSKLKDYKRLKEIISEAVSRARNSLVSGGHSTAVLRASSYISQQSAFADSLSGLDYYFFIEKLEREFEQRKEEVGEKLTEMMHRIFRPDHYIVSYTGERESLEPMMKLCSELKESLYTDLGPLEEGRIETSIRNEGFTTSGQVQYVAQVGNFKKAGLEFKGALSILRVIMGYEYLWLNLRVKGGAYGCMNGYKRSGGTYFVSYRDPHLKRTLEVYEGIADYVEGFEADEREMTKYIIGTISGKDVPKTPQMKGQASRSAYFCKISEAMLQKERDEILNAQPEDIRALAAHIREALKERCICVVGSESAIEKNRELFGVVRPLIGPAGE